MSIAEGRGGIQEIGCVEPMVHEMAELTSVAHVAMLDEEGKVFMKFGLKQLKSKQSKGIKHARAIVLALRDRV